MPRYLTTEPWFYDNKYYPADLTAPFVFDHSGPPGLNWYPLDKPAEDALQKQYEHVKADFAAKQAAGAPPTLVKVPHKIPDTSAVKLPDAVTVPVAQQIESDPSPFLAPRKVSEPTTMSGVQTGKRPSDVDPVVKR
jgi:hypothetical protein